MLSFSEILIRLALASLFGALIGLERERKDWAAGLRTHMLVSVGSCLIMIVSAFGFADILGTEHVSLDPSRVAAQVVSGIGFIGAGTILFLKQGAVRGLTTAAGLWTVAAIGLATGGGLYFAAGATTIIALIILWVLQPIERAYSKRFKHKTLRVVTTLDADTTSLLNDLFNRFQTKITDFSLNRLGDEFVYQMKIDNSNLDSIDDLLRELKKNSSVKEIDWT
ncbi:MAG: MgtC/SapB family protein [Tenuifilaceae bacterium]|jgi:putative Mg2+ transporter-C (MgtC) family protein|nr:MgtC/SapB family protein [Bacteroidales bacterium]MDI9515442.1 MgtC/SapB family protein [Bacteroidota bacterium]OQC62383.1 MAG: putative Mg(2+) transport ATPase [Bacteroidetes bacterium ADurb.Bin008]HNV82424.1 MgtC/SapB family protein [Tenuifilaceae bacterium]MZP82986.1 MgtC/SapB family protein [Bacteroidales bacterium]